MIAAFSLLVAALPAWADPVALRAPGPYAGVVAVAGWPDPSVGLWRDRFGVALSVHEGASVALDAAYRWTPHRREIPGRGRVGLDLAVAGGPVVPVVVAGGGLTLGPQVVLRRHRPGGTWSGSLAAPAAWVFTSAGGQARLPLLAGNGFTVERGRLGVGVHAEAGPVWSPGAPVALSGRLGLVVARSSRDGERGQPR